MGFHADLVFFFFFFLPQEGKAILFHADLIAHKYVQVAD
jgi:hypothetical protein